MKFAILATGESLTAEQVDAVRGFKIIAVSDAWTLAPDCVALVSADAAWWRHHEPDYDGYRVSNSRAPDTEKPEYVPNGTNSGALAIRWALQNGATEIVLLGFDGHGSHFFGEHPRPLNNTTEHRRRTHLKQHQLAADLCKEVGVPIWNCSPGTVIDAYPIKTLEEVLCSQPAVDAMPVRTSLNLQSSLTC